MMKHLYISVLLLLVSICGLAQTGANAVKRDGSKNQVLLSLSNGEVKYYNTADLESIDFNNGEITFKQNAGNDSYKDLITGMRFLKSERATPMSEEELSNFTGDLVARMLVLAYNPKSSVNDAERIDYLLSTLSQQQIPVTRGVWSQAKAIVDFGMVMKDANKLHRCTVIGAMSKFGVKSKEERQRIWRDIMDADVLPKEYRMSSDQFWKAYSMGDLDYYAIPIYKAIMDHALDSPSSATERLATDMANNGMRHIDLTLAIAPKLIEAGANIVFAFGDDLIQTSKLAYDFVETNGKVVFEVVEGNLTAETFIDACNNNLKLLSSGLNDIIPDGSDLAEILTDATTEQIKQLNQEINDAIAMAGNNSLSARDVAFFVDRMKNVLKIDWKPEFLDEDYVSKDKTYFHITSNPNKTHVFHYYDADGEIMWGGKCSVDPKYIYVQASVLDEKCDLLRNPKKVGDVVAIPFVEGYQSISLGSSTDGDVKFKLFYPKNETVEDLFVLHDASVGYSDYYHSDYNLVFSEDSEGHTILLYKYYKGAYIYCFGGHYTADGYKMGITVGYIPKKIEDEDNPFDKLGFKEGDITVITYEKTEKGISLYIPGMSLSFRTPVDINGIWWTEDAMGKFNIDDGGWTNYWYILDGLEDLQTKGFFHVDQSKMTVSYEITWTGRSDQTIYLPSSALYPVELKTKYISPFTLEVKNGITYLKFKMFDYQFVLVRDRNVNPDDEVELETVDKTGDPGDKHMKVSWNEKSDKFEVKGRALKDISVNSDQDFIHIEEPTIYSSSVMIKFKVDMNPLPKERKATITVKATRADGTKGIATMTVSQEPGLSADFIELISVSTHFPSSKTIEESYSTIGGVTTNEYDEIYYWHDRTNNIGYSFDLTDGTTTYSIEKGLSEGAHFELSNSPTKNRKLKVSFDLWDGFNEGKATNFKLIYEVYDDYNKLVGQHVLKASEVPIKQPDKTWESRQRSWGGTTGDGVRIDENSGSVYYEYEDGRTQKYTFNYNPSSSDKLEIRLKWKKDPYNYFAD